MAENGVFFEMDDPQFGRVKSVDSPMRVESHPKGERRPVPRLGEHTREVLAELGFRN
jgi:crotonobetainyl-CoA:carnitine CoA-transferase CaiB-like acyl-CoA transferase